MTMENELEGLAEPVRDALAQVGKRCDAATFDALHAELIRLARENAELRARAESATAWIEEAPHGENCYLSDHYDGDPGNQCNCGKESVLARLESGDMSAEWIDALTERAERAERAEAELAALRKRVEWQPIETAPENCDLVLVYTPDDGDGAQIELECREDGVWINHANCYEHFVVVGGSGAAGPDCVCIGPSDHAPYTHWTNAPDPPEATA